MKAIYNNSTIPEREAKIRYHFPENIMMENAAVALEKLVLTEKAIEIHKKATKNIEMVENTLKKGIISEDLPK